MYTSQKIRDLDARLNAINTGAGVPVTVDTLIRQTELPFTKRILRTRVSSRFKLPTQLEIYEGKTDPMDHLDSYKNLILLQGCSDEVMCKAFSTTLKGSTRSWFRKLPPVTIDSFGDLSRLFIANFMSCRIRQKNASHLFTIHQKKTESLKDYVKRFNQAILEVEGPNDTVVIMAMMEGLWPGPLFDFLSKNVPETLSALHNKDEARSKRFDRDSKRTNERRPRTPPRRLELIMPLLNAFIAQMLTEIKHEEFVKWPRKIKTDPWKRNKNKYYEFHQDHGHNTEDCFQLKEQIANLIKKRYMRKYVADRPLPNSPERRYGDDRPTVGDIQVIHGRFRSGNSIIANINIQRILVDNGSLADILFVSAFDKMKIRLDKLQPFQTPLIGYGGNMTHPLKWIKLPNARATYQRLVNKMFKELIGKKRFLVTKRRIEANPDQIQALIVMSLPRNIREWNEESKTAFQQLKKYLGSPSLLTIPTIGEELFVYLSILPIAVNTSGRLLKWSIELSEFYIDYRPRMAIKAQALADFMIESTHENAPEPKATPPEVETPEEQSSDKDLSRWMLFVDGSSNQHGCGAGLVLQTSSSDQMEYAIRIGFKATNNEAEYEALLAGLRVATELGVDSLDAFSDSQLVVNQVQKDYLAKDTRMVAYLDEVKTISGKIRNFKICQIPREENKKADALANLASVFDFTSDRSIPLEFLSSLSIGIADPVF
ncbi:hypothetical protein Acr_22g0003430 [Actinidia rufa]|uniref:RNase H type-1 domain-containing protein n=1 Tax=Actinidia rufa TaxID=165716 RepID=A0A7J0GJJ2_9ERIC|nr:hypothetical protein Acr_22g0003430 [Actinidia rufa]